MLVSTQRQMYDLIQIAKKKLGTNKDSEALVYIHEAIERSEPSFKEDTEYWLNNLSSTIKAIRDYVDEDTIRLIIEDLEGYLEG